MKKILFLLLMTVAAYGQMAQVRNLTLSTNGVGSVSFLDVRGELHAVHVYTGSTTGTVTVAYAPLGGLTAVNLATNSVVGQKIFRPVAQSTDTAGTAITDYKPYVFAGEDVTFSITNGANSASWKCVLIVK